MSESLMTQIAQISEWVLSGIINKMNKVRVFADFHNADGKGRVRLNCAGTMEDIERQGIVLREGQSFIIYSEELEVEGVVHYSEEEKLWTAVIDWNAIQEVEPVVSQLTIQDIISAIEEKSANGDYIYRGENKYYEKVSSTLYRECQEVADVGMDRIQKQMLYAAEDYDINRLGQSRSQQVYWMWGGGYNPLEYTERQFEILAELQHWGGETNLIDFTTDYRVALFFTCDGCYNEDGRIILQNCSTMKPIIWNPTEPTHRIEAQKSTFVRPPEGFIQPNPEDVIRIPKYLKVPLLKYLVRQDPPITHKTIYNDLHGFIRLQSRYRDAVVKFYIAHDYEKRGDIAKTPQAREENYKEAINYYQIAIELMPNLIMPHINCGIVYGKLKDFDAAIACFNETLDWEPNNGMAYCNRGIAYGKTGKTDKAIVDFNKATELEPKRAAAYSNRGTVRFLKGEINSAIADLNKAIELEPERAEAYISRGNVYNIIGEINSAIKDFDKAIHLNPNLVEAYTGRGVAYARKGDFDQAIQNYTQAIEFKSDYAKAYSNRGITLLRLKEWEKAKTDFTTAKNMGVNIIAAFHSDYTDVAGFEQKTGIQLPEDIAALLTPPQT